MFGSTVRGGQTPPGDIDFHTGFDPQRHLSLIERDALEDGPSDVFGVPRIDPVNRKYLNRHLALRILAEAELQSARR